MVRKNRTLIQFQIDPCLKKKFIQKATEENKTLTDILTMWINEYLNENSKTDIDTQELNKHFREMKILINEVTNKLVEQNKILEEDNLKQKDKYKKLLEFLLENLNT